MLMRVVIAMLRNKAKDSSCSRPNIFGFGSTSANEDRDSGVDLTQKMHVLATDHFDRITITWVEWVVSAVIVPENL
jgi:hypothetical protein